MAKADSAPKETQAAPAPWAADTKGGEAVPTSTGTQVEVGSTAAAAGAVDAVEKVLVEVPKDFRLTDHTGVHDFKAGIQRVERWVADHWFAKAHGIREVKE